MLVHRPMMFSHLQTGRSSARLRRIYHPKAERAQRSRRSGVGGKLDHKHCRREQLVEGRWLAYGLNSLEYGYEEECRVDWGHHKELPVWSLVMVTYKFRIDLTARRDQQGLT